MKERGKTFLNQSFNENGYVKWELKSGKDREYTSDVLSGSLVVADCSQAIHLDFDCENASQIQKRLDKLDLLILELTNMRSVLCKMQVEQTKTKKFFY
jgi:hypothetical protein